MEGRNHSEGRGRKGADAMIVSPRDGHKVHSTPAFPSIPIQFGGMPSSSPRALAIVGILVSVLTLAAIALFVPLLVYRANQLRVEIEQRSIQFKHNSDRIWQQLIDAGKEVPMAVGRSVTKVPPANDGGGTTVFSRVPRSPWNSHICQGCHSLTCQSGLPGPSGPAGPDGDPGEPGRQGAPGDDGFDVQLQPEADLPCVICPAGPPGQRGPQGERGRCGEAGTLGEQGPEGKGGMDGPPGRFGPPGNPGSRGPMGRAGPAGDQVIAGVGIKGPQGPPGPAGPKGPHGGPGKASRDVGMSGKPGPIGPPGLIGSSGVAGENGGFGPPGEPGEPASYCPSDCGVSHIMAPSFMAEEPAEKPPPSFVEKEKPKSEGYRRLVQKR